ncbi:beta-galactosidase GalA [Paraflavitalea sp. CAU 1676]|nr:beta-galactosidase GalA [Paraflavitalea sp. CAU 1676]MDF2193482.1 beta-galactosidase GalA [Paraflavitalea sp. CAU 1676]
MKKYSTIRYCVIITIALLIQLRPAYSQYKGPERLSLDKGWRFYPGDHAFPIIKGHGMSYNNAKAGRASGAAAPNYDDSKWASVQLPHDWAVESPFDSSENLSQGFRKRGIGWYRRHFRLDASDRGKHLELQFEGIATHATVWVNGTVVHRNWCGYTSFYIDITALVKYGEELNNIAIRVDADAQEGWWYEGAGIYRHAWMVKRSPVHIMTDGVFAHPVKDAAGNWSIPAEITLENSGQARTPVEVELTLLDKNGKKVTGGTATVAVNPLDNAVVKLTVPVANPALWWPDNPTLYQVITRVKQHGQAVDSLLTTCGFRTIRFEADSGFFLNDKNMKLKGVCNHQDHAGVGVAVPNSIWEFRLRKLKEMGVNAYRCAHNPPSAAFLDACDRMGIMVMDENRNFNASPAYVRQLEWMVRRDRNHPSIILWSVFNEEPMQGTEIGYEMVRRMSAEVKRLDTTRPVTAAMNGGLFAPLNVSQAVDVVGFNYQIGSYDRFHAANPTMPLTSSEDASGLMVRGEFKTDKAKHLLDAYDTQKPAWGATHRVAWKAVAERPYLAGCFVWTGFDYRGEPTPYDWPTAGSNFGIMDLCGFPKTAFYIHQAQWVHDRPVLQVVPHWNWPADSVGRPVKVMVMSNAETVKLLLNGKLIGEQKVDPYEMNSWEVPYRPGKLEAIGYKQGKEVSRYKVETTGAPVSIQLLADRAAMYGDGWDAMPVTVQVLDAKERPVPTANIPIEFELTGPANIIGVGNGDPNSHEVEKGNKRSLFNGLAQVIVQTEEAASAPLRLMARSKGLKMADITIPVIARDAVQSVPVVYPALVLDGWRVSQVTVQRPDANKAIDANDMNSWAPIKSGLLQPMEGGNFVVYRTVFTPFAAQQKKGGVLTLKNVTGKASLYVDNKLVETKNNPASADMIINIPPATGERILSVLFEAMPGQRVGIGGVSTMK